MDALVVLQIVFYIFTLTVVWFHLYETTQLIVAVYRSLERVHSEIEKHYAAADKQAQSQV